MQIARTDNGAEFPLFADRTFCGMCTLALTSQCISASDKCIVADAIDPKSKYFEWISILVENVVACLSWSRTHKWQWRKLLDQIDQISALSNTHVELASNIAIRSANGFHREPNGHVTSSATSRVNRNAAIALCSDFGI